MRDLTHDEQRAIAALRRLAARWPRTLGLQAGTGGLNIIALDRPDRWPGSAREWNERHADRIDIPAEGGDPW